MSGQSIRPSLTPAAAATGWVVRVAGVQDTTAVTLLAKLESNRVGFIPLGGLREYVASGWCTVATDVGSQVVGYLLGRPSLRYARWCRPVTQLVTHPDLRRRGVATSLVARLCVDAAADGRDCLQAWSRSDLAANHLWDRLGFTIIGERRPESARRRPSLLWRMPLTAAGLVKLVELPRVGGYRAGRQVTQGLFVDPGTLIV